jgi:RES domain-containing protein
MTRAWRIVKTRYAANAFNGDGARLNGGRWNSVGIPMVYTAGSQALAILELLVHLDTTVPLPSYSICAVDIDDSLTEVIKISDLPSDWDQSPPPTVVQDMGNEWVSRATSVVLAVPSAVVTAEQNYLINSSHPDFSKLVIGTMVPFNIDPRLR